ncbi:ATPase [Clostridium sp.]|uniref:ATPase n=1 Tax=Clostridium sp. TaxID=1506 RepID=UPI00262D1DC2|nr:ATPase [Clostridium sp.]
MNRDSGVMDLLDYLRSNIENASKVPITGKVVVDRKEVLELIDEITNCLPDEIKKAQWVLSEKERILAEARKENESVKQETYDMMQKRIDNHNIVKEAELRAQEIIANAQRQAKTIRLGSREYADEVLSQLENEIANKREIFLDHMKNNMEKFAMGFTEDLDKTTYEIRSNIKELRGE